MRPMSCFVWSYANDDPEPPRDNYRGRNQRPTGSETEHFTMCLECGAPFDMRDLREAVPHP
jgi:hypothetical protein